MGKCGNHQRHLVPLCIWFDCCWDQNNVATTNLSLTSSRVQMGLWSGGGQNQGHFPQGELTIKNFLKREPRGPMPVAVIVCMDCIGASMEARSVQEVVGFPAHFSGQRQSAIFFLDSLPSTWKIRQNDIRDEKWGCQSRGLSSSLSSTVCLWGRHEVYLKIMIRTADVCCLFPLCQLLHIY